MNLRGFIGPSYKLDSVNVDCQRSVNLYPEMISSGNGKEGALAYLKSTPGLEKIANVGTGKIRLVHTDYSGQVIVVSGMDVYTIFQMVGGVQSINPTKIGDLTTGVYYDPLDPIPDNTRPIKAVSGKIGTMDFTIITDGGIQNFMYQLNTFTVSFGTFASYGFPPIPYATHVDYLDGYLIYIASDNKFHVSEWNNFTVNALDFATAEGNPDLINSMLVVGRDLWIFNENSLEIYANTGNASFPFERVNGGFIKIGCLAPYSTATINHAAFWLGRDEKGQGTIYMSGGAMPQRISTTAIEEAISKYNNVEKATAYTYTKNGHSFYVINFDEMSWCYDISTQLWHERAFTNESTGDLERHRLNNLSFRPHRPFFNEDYSNIFVGGDYDNNKLYILNEEYRKDDTAPITRLRVFPHITNGLKRLFYNSLQIDMEVGVGLDGDVQGSDPQVMLSFSNDSGHTWSNELWASAGKKIGGIGEYKKRVIWNRLGSARDRVFKIKITDPVKVTLINAEINVQQGTS